LAGFQSRFDEAAAEAKRVFSANSGDVRAIVPGMWASEFYRLLNGISDLLKKVDARSIQHPEYLAHTNGSIPEYAVSLITTVPSTFDAGAANFVQTNLSGLVFCEDRLAKAIGKHHHKVREVKDQYVRELQQISSDAAEYLEASRKAAEDVGGFLQDAKSASEQISEAQAETAAALSEVQKIRNLVTKLASGDGRGKSLEALKRRAEGKLETIDDVLAKSITAKEAVETTGTQLANSGKAIEALLNRLDAVEKKAQDILSLSNQAGLAASYLRESGDLKKKSYLFTGILYATAIVAVLIAAFYVLPSLERTIADGKIVLDSKAFYVTLLRATVLAPLVYVLYFTTKQISSLETLRMDYAEKAAASLAYSGYKDEMSVDPDLLDQLRGSLLLRFAEHPERLLRKTPSKEALKIKLPGFSASSESASESNKSSIRSDNDEDKES